MTDVRIMWPFEVDWSDPYKVTYSFKTDVFTNRAGGEQRRALRQTPRKTLTFSIMADGDRLRAFNRIMATGQNMPVVMPEMTRRAEAASASVGGADTLSLVAVPSWVTVGAELVLVAPGQRKVVAVESIAGSSVTFTAIIGAWPAGTGVHPALTGLLREEVSASRSTNTLALPKIEFDVEPGSETYAPPSAPASFGGVEVFDLRPNWHDPVDVKAKWPTPMVDFGYGRTVAHRPVDFPTRLTEATWLQRTSAEADLLLNAFLRAKGRRGTLLMSTGEQDLLPLAALTSAGTTFTVAGEDVFDAYADNPVHNAIAVHLRNGSTIYRAVSSMALDEGDTVIMVSSAWGANISLAEIDAVSWLLSTRFGSDDMTIEWITDAVSQAKVAFQSLPSVSPADYLDLRATVEGDIRETVAGDDRAVVYFPV